MVRTKWEFRKVSLFNLEGTLSAATCWNRTYGGVAQLGEHLPCKQGVSGSIPLISTNGPIAQLLEHTTDNREVCGSSPLWPTILSPWLKPDFSS